MAIGFINFHTETLLIYSQLTRMQPNFITNLKITSDRNSFSPHHQNERYFSDNDGGG
jgi:hypothetical protein